MLFPILNVYMCNDPSLFIVYKENRGSFFSEPCHNATPGKENDSICSKGGVKDVTNLKTKPKVSSGSSSADRIMQIQRAIMATVGSVWVVDINHSMHV